MGSFVAMPENTILDPFKPTQPRIPGVSIPEEASRDSGEPRENHEAPGLMGPPPSVSNDRPSQWKLLWIGLTLAGVLTTSFLLFGLKQKPVPTRATAVAGPVQPALLITDAPPVDAKLPTGPGKIATTSQLAKTWSAKRFYFRDPITLKPIPAMVVHLPGGTFWGFSLLEPFGHCELEYVTDLQKLRTSYGFDAVYPMVVDPCNGTVFDLTHYGNAPSGLVRGEIEKGPGWRPPTAIEIRTQDEQVLAERMER
jgi:hypothetical protein